MLTNFLIWLEETPPSVWVREYPSLLGFPFILFLHTLGLAMLAGVSIAVDLWLLRAATFARDASPTNVMRSPVIATSAVRAGEPVPSITRPFRMSRSACAPCWA